MQIVMLSRKTGKLGRDKGFEWDLAEVPVVRMVHEAGIQRILQALESCLPVISPEVMLTVNGGLRERVASRFMLRMLTDS